MSSWQKRERKNNQVTLGLVPSGRHSNLFLILSHLKSAYHRLNDHHGTLEIMGFKAQCLEKELKGINCHFWLTQSTFNPLYQSDICNVPPRMSKWFAR